jgi:ABC-2 type transport system ATP-binding protein
VEPIVRTQNLTKIFNQQTIAVNNLTMDVPDGSIYGFLGPNGSGKTTTIKLLLGLIRPSAGTVEVFGEPMGMDSSDLRHRIGYLPTNPQFPDKMTPISYLDFIGRTFGLSKEERVPRITELIRAVDLLSLSSQEIRKFSTGEITRVGIAACLINNPDLLIMDEPTSGLDPIGRASTVKLITELGKQEDKTVFVSSHILADIDRVCSHIGIINDGKLVFNGRITDVKRLISMNSFELHVEGEAGSFVEKTRQISSIIDVEFHNHVVQVTIDEPDDYAKVLGQVFHILHEEEGVDLVSFSSGSQSLEEAFLNLLEEEKTYGFLRAIGRDA